MTVVNSWGYKVNGSWTGMTGYLQRGKADVGATALYITESRISVLTYLAGTTRTRNAFLFRQPALSFVDNIFILPFSGSVWLTSVGLIAIIGFLLHGALKWENMKTHVTWSDTALLAVGAVCQQGVTMEAQRVPGRIITISLFVIVIFLYTSYSACIVALLQSSTTSIRTLHDLLRSGLILGVYDTVYNRHFFQAVSDPVRRSIYTQKVSPAGRPHLFLPLEEGIKRIRTSRFAFHVELGPGFKFVSDTFLEEEKCSLQTITFFTEFTEPHVAVKKNSAFKEILTVSYRKIHESGLKQRENMRFYHAKPECANRGTGFVSVGLQECYSAMLMLCYGMLLSLGILMAEIFVNKRYNWKQARRV